MEYLPLLLMTLFVSASASELLRTQRLFKIHGPPSYKHKGIKVIRPGPLGPHVHYREHEHDTHYEYIRPHKPPPIPPFYNGPNIKYSSFSSGRHPPANYIVKTPAYGISHKPSNLPPSIIKDSFRSSPPIPSYDFISSHPTTSHIINSDDNNGPIHEIPAPDLGPKSGHHHHHHHHHHHSHFDAEVSSHHHFEPEPPIKQPHFVEPEFSKETPGYEVTESIVTNDKVVEGPDGTKSYYAPDPDPALPSHKIQPETNPHSIPSETGSLPSLDPNNHFPTGQEYQILEGGTIPAPIPNLSSQELFDLMNSFPRDEYTVGQHPVFTVQQNDYKYLPPTPDTHPNSNYLLPTSDSLQNFKLAHQTTPDSHSYVEVQSEIHSTPSFPPSAGPQFTSHHQEVDTNSLQPDFYQYDHEASESENKDSIRQNVVRETKESTQKTESVKKVLPSDLSNLIPDEESVKDLKNNIDIPLYSTLPSKEAAEVFATLQAAGDVANKLRGDQGEELPVMPKPKPHASEENPIQKETVVIQKSLPLYEASFISKSLDSADDAVLKIGQGADSERFGQRMKPK